MPNWIEGTLKLRGKSENLKRFFTEFVEASTFCDRERPGSCVETNFDEKKYWCQVDIHNEPHIKGTHRAFLGEDDCAYWENTYNTIVLYVKQAWDFVAEEFAIISKECGIDIRLYGFECGLEFCREIEIINGEITINNTIKYADWNWECPMPNLGG